MFSFLLEVTVPLYIRRYTKSKSTRPKYFEKGKHKIPLIFCNKELYKSQGIREPDGVNYYWDNFNALKQGRKVIKQFLVEAKTGEKVISNTKYVGKEKTNNINGQGIFSGNIRSFEKDTMLGQIKDCIRPYVKGVKITEFPIGIRVEIHDKIEDKDFSNGQDWDLENRFLPYSKALHDLLVDEGVIPDDNIYFITAPAQPVFVPIDDSNNRKMVIKFFKDNRPEILNNMDYKLKHGK